MADLKSNRDDVGKLVLRLALAGIVLFHGVFKFRHGVAWISGPLSAFGLPGFVAWGAYVAELIAPLLLLVGYRVRLAALVIAFDMVMAVVLVLRDRVWTINAGGGWAIELEALIFFAALVVALLGPGRYAVGRR
jgi:putative oxidoreductase